MQPYNLLLRRILILTLVDIVVLLPFVWWVDTTPDVSIAELLIIPTIFIINLVAAGITAYLFKKRILGKTIGINAIVASVVFHFLFQAWFVYYDKVHFKSYYFKLDGKQYELTLRTQENFFYLSDVSNQAKGSTTGLLTGDYKTTPDSGIILTDNAKRLILYKDKLIGYPTSKDTISLKDKED